MIYLKASMAETARAGDTESVLAALQDALKLEHATIPTYLYALYSIAPGTNDTIAEIIGSVVVDEMLHMALVANMINALGGSPVLNQPDFVPTYPGPLPGGVDGGLTVRLAPCSIALVREVFMGIEEPENELDFPVVTARAGEEPLTIGQFYAVIKQSITALGNDAFAPGPRNQIGPDRMDQAVVVTDVETASRAIDIIVEQGEGTLTEPLQVVGKGYAHYYRFAEPAAGPDADPDDRYFYDTVNHPVPFEPEGVYPVPENPRVHDTAAPTYPPGSVGQVANDTFNYTYTSLLKVLHRSLNGQPDLLDTAVAMMMSLRQQAMDMASGTNTANQNIGPTFEYQPVNPGLVAPSS